MDRWTTSTLALALVGGETTFKGKKVAPKDALRTQWTGHDPVRAVGDAIAIDGCKFPAAVKDGQLHVSTVPDGAPSTGVTAANASNFSWTKDGARHDVAIRFLQDEKGAWRYRAESAWEYKIGGETLRLIDTDANGRYDAFGEDGCTTYDSSFVLPLKRSFPLGANLVEISSIAADGSSFVATVTPIRAGKGELAALVRINQWRAADGLGPVSYDPVLCEHCTAHAEYLHRHAWSGNTDPHGEEPGSNGATPGGAQAAKRSVICKGSAATTLDGFFDTYYHRIPFMCPSLEHIGINEKPEEVTVIDVREGLETPWPREAGWACPVFSPAPGARNVPVAAIGEEPHEPVSNLASRGLPLMVLFERQEKGVRDFQCRLFERKGTKEVEVATLPADPWEMLFIQGVVPAERLRPKTQYRAVFTWSVQGKAAAQAVDFATQ